MNQLKTKVIHKLLLMSAWGLCFLALCATGAWAQGTPVTAFPSPSVVVVLAGGGAKGFAHLAVLRQLEQDRIPIARIVGTSMGAVIGGLYASGMSVDDIEQTLGELDPSKVALDQLNRLEWPSRTRAYQQKYPVDFEFGIQNGGVSFARGVSDGQRFLALLQSLTQHVPSDVDFNDLKIPFRAVATRYRDGEMKVFDRGALHLAIRASMAAPAVFAPVDVEGETYVDGGLVANLPVEVALAEGADVIVASFLGGGLDAVADGADQPSHALVVANRMLDILIRQNEKRHLALLRPQDLLIQPLVQDIGFAAFNRASEVVQRGRDALVPVQAQFAALRETFAMPQHEQPRTRLAFDQREKRVVAIQATGHKYVPEHFIQSVLSPMVGQEFSAQQVERYMDELYTSGYFDMVSYSLVQQQDDAHELMVTVREKPYIPHFFKTSMGFSTEADGVTQFSVGLGYRRPWLTASGLEFSLDARLGTQSELGLRFHQALSRGLSLEAGAGLDRNYLPMYLSSVIRDEFSTQKLAFIQQTVQSLDAALVFDYERKANMKLAWVQSRIRRMADTILDFSSELDESIDQVQYQALRAQWQIDQLDSVSFPTRGYFLGGHLEQGVSGAIYRGGSLSAKWAHSVGPHIVNLGLKLEKDQVTLDCDKCRSPSQLFLGGFQNMGAYRMGQLTGDQLAHVQGTYMYRLTEGGLFNQRTYVGTVLEAGDAWYKGEKVRMRLSGTLFVAVDSKIGDIYLGAARGANQTYNLFLQLGRRFNF
jgi:NTE family protein